MCLDPVCTYAILKRGYVWFMIIIVFVITVTRYRAKTCDVIVGRRDVGLECRPPDGRSRN